MKKILLVAALAVMALAAQAESYICTGFLTTTTYTIVGDTVTSVDKGLFATEDKVYTIIEQDDTRVLVQTHIEGLTLFLSRTGGESYFIYLGDPGPSWCSAVEGG